MQEEAAMHGFLQRVELEKYLPAFRSLGVESFVDFEQVEDRDLDAIGMSTLKKRRFRRGLQEEASGLGNVTPQKIDFGTKAADSGDWHHLSADLSAASHSVVLSHI